MRTSFDIDNPLISWRSDKGPGTGTKIPCAMRPVLFLCSFLALTCTAQAQLGERIRRTLNGDSLAPPDHDTAYVMTYRSALTASAIVTYSGVDVDLERDNGTTLSYSTNTNERYGFGLNYKWLSAEASFHVPAFNAYDPSLGKSDSKGFGLGVTGRRLWARGFWNYSQGFYLNGPERWIAGRSERDGPWVRSDLSNSTFMLSVNYALSGKRRYSQNAALFQMERQKRSAGTFVLGCSGWSSDVHADSSLVTRALQDTFQIATGFTRVRRSVAGLTFGYTHTFAFWRKGFLQAAFLPGVAYLHQRITPTVGSELEGRGLAALTELKLGAGYNGDRWYTALTTAFYYCTSDIGELIALGTNYSFVRFAAGLRFGAPRAGVLRKVGL